MIKPFLFFLVSVLALSKRLAGSRTLIPFLARVDAGVYLRPRALGRFGECNDGLTLLPSKNRPFIFSTHA